LGKDETAARLECNDRLDVLTLDRREPSRSASLRMCEQNAEANPGEQCRHRVCDHAGVIRAGVRRGRAEKLVQRLWRSIELNAIEIIWPDPEPELIEEQLIIGRRLDRYSDGAVAGTTPARLVDEIDRIASTKKERLEAFASIRRRMARTYQIIMLFNRDTIIRNVKLALLGLSPLRWNAFVDLERQTHLDEEAHHALQQVGLAHIADRPLTETSYGERRRVEIAMALAQKPKVLLLDEPFAGLSIDERRGVKELLTTIPKDVTVVMIEHDMDVALDFAERITLLHFGQVIVEGTRAEVVADPRTREVYLGHD